VKACCLPESLQPVEDAVLSIDAGVNDSGTVAAVKNLQLSDPTGRDSMPDCQQEPDSPRSAKIEGGTGDDVIQSHQAANIDHTGVQYKAEHLEDATHVNYDETNHLALSHTQVLTASSRQQWWQRPATPFPQTIPSAADLSFEETYSYSGQFLLPSIAKLHRPILQHRGGEPGCQEAIVDHKSFFHVVNSLTFCRIMLRSSDLAVFFIPNCICSFCCVQYSVFVLNKRLSR